ncbi:MAG: hypothetical protein RQ872_06395 [Sulfolobaceae archaeon]|jgi:Zn-dependent alcohol dehydrogenase|nr:hypothetical protein [Sulfolobaceae archaeon]
MSNSQDENKKKTVTIRGIDMSLYERLVKVARDSGKTVGEVMNQAMSTFLGVAGKAGEKIDQAISMSKDVGKSFIEGFNEAKKNIVIISDLESIEVKKEELVSFGKPVSFRNIGKLVLLDIDQDTFNTFIDSIISVNELVIPRNLNKFFVLQKCKFVKKITQS